MLKIKEDKMQELEKFGFKRWEKRDGCVYFYVIYNNYSSYASLLIERDRRIIFQTNSGLIVEDLEIFYKLFANDMFEKDGE